jgi:hypothetical protein
MLQAGKSFSICFFILLLMWSFLLIPCEAVRSLYPEESFTVIANVSTYEITSQISVYLPTLQYWHSQWFKYIFLIIFSSVFIYLSAVFSLGSRGSVVGWGTVLQAARLRVRFSMRSLDFSMYIILPALTVELRSIQPLTEISTRNFHEGRSRPAHKAGNPTAICESIV